MDIVPPYLDLAGTSGMRKYTIVAPADGTIQNYVEDLSGAGLMSYVVILKLDSFWHLMMVFEPQSEDAATNAEQHASFSVQVGQTVQRGDVIGDLVVSRVAEESYPHLHFGVFYKDPLESYDDVYATLRVHDGATASPEILGTRLGIPSTFFCPYDYLTDAGRAVLDGVPKLDILGNACSCACSYGSSGGDCGSCP
jgi:murein DD-endopeptidase MepM/ murein hydrolase activator NlpD